MTTKTALASHPVCDEVARLVAHLPCLERAAADPSAPDEVRRAVRAQIAMSRTALALLGADLPADGVGPLPERNGTETNA